MSDDRRAVVKPAGRRTDLYVDIAVFLSSVTLDYVTFERPVRWRWGGPVDTWVVAVYIIAGASLLFWRRRRPVLVFVLAWVYCLGRFPMDGLIPFAPALFVLQALAARLPDRTSRIAAWSLAVPFGFHLLDGRHVRGHDWFSAATVGVSSALLTVAAYQLGRRELAHRERAALDAERERAVAAETLAAERRRIARELHDNLGHAITAMTLQAAGARAVTTSAGPAPDQRIVSALSAIEETGGTAMRELHRLLGVLRSQGEVDAQPLTAPGVREIEDLVAGARAGGLVVQADVTGRVDDLDASVELAVYRVVQESIANAMRHDGPGSEVVISIDSTSHATVVEVSSRRPLHSQIAPSTSTGGYGLSGLRERVVLVGGSFSAGPEGEVFVTRASFPRGPRRAGARPGEGRGAEAEDAGR